MDAFGKLSLDRLPYAHKLVLVTRRRTSVCALQLLTSFIGKRNTSKTSDMLIEMHTRFLEWLLTKNGNNQNDWRTESTKWIIIQTICSIYHGYLSHFFLLAIAFVHFISRCNCFFPSHRNSTNLKHQTKIWIWNGNDSFVFIYQSAWGGGFWYSF